MPITKDMNLVEKALTTAYEAHWRQRSFSKRPYILHPIRVMEQMDTDEERAVALLHDVLEDSPIPLEHLAMHFPARVVEAVVALTKPPPPELDPEEDHDLDDVAEARQKAYDDYLGQVAGNALAIKVKIADLRDNMRVERLPKMTNGALRRLRKYYDALAFLIHHPTRF